LFSENIMIGSREPVVTATRKTTTGQSINTVQYQQVGLIVGISASQPPKDSGRKALDVQVRTEVSSLGEGGPEIAPGVKGVRTRSVSINHTATLQYGRPLVMLNVTYPTGDEKGSATAFVMRTVFSEVKP
jgi:type II secretory pathway component GspD/PulD (secretin)